MGQGFFKLVYRLKRLMTQEFGQDLVEYAMVMALVAFGATAGMRTLATGLNNSFSTMSSDLNADL
jgi:pilus assembly protein Flp/PilA